MLKICLVVQLCIDFELTIVLLNHSALIFVLHCFIGHQVQVIPLPSQFTLMGDFNINFFATSPL